MLEEADITQLVATYERIQENLDTDRSGIVSKFVKSRSRERTAAQILCTEMNKFVHERDRFWNCLAESSEKLGEHRENESEILSNLERFIEQESTILRRLGVDDKTSTDIVVKTFSAFSIMGETEDPSPHAVENLRERLSNATDLICNASKGPMGRAYDKLIGTKGARIFAGSALGSANVLVAVSGEGGLVSWGSLKVGYNVAKGDVEGLIDMLEAAVE